MTPRRYTSALLFVALLPVPVRAQGDTVPDSPCTYAACALRVQGNALLAGTEGREVASFGLFSAPQLRPWIEVSDSTAHYVEIIDRDYVSGQVLTLSGSLLSVLGLVAVQGWRDSDRQFLGGYAVLTGAILAFAGGRKVKRARNAMDSAVWWYNRTLSGTPDGSESVPPSPAFPVRGVQHHGRAGAVLGSAVGLAGGLAVSARHDSSETAAGLSETLAFTVAGTLIGHLIGKGLQR